MNKFSIVGIIVICLSLGCGYAYSVKHPHSIENGLEYTWNKCLDKTTGNLVKWFIKYHLLAEQKTCDYIHTDNLYDVDYDIITKDYSNNVQVITYGPPTYLTSGNRVIIFYDLPDGGQYKRIIDNCKEIKVNKIEKIK